MSQRHMTLAQLGDSSGLRRMEVIHFIEFLEAGGHVTERIAVIEPRLPRLMRAGRRLAAAGMVAVQGGP
jgi:hypothetical protein